MDNDLMPAKNSEASDVKAIANESAEILSDLNDLRQSTKYLIVPRYEGIPVRWQNRGEQFQICRGNGLPVEHPDLQIDCRTIPDCLRNGDGLLVGYRGKKRCATNHTEHYLLGEPSPVSRLVLVAYPPVNMDTNSNQTFGELKNFKIIPHRIAEAGNVDRCALEIMSRDGVELTRLDRSEGCKRRYLYRPVHKSQPEGGYSLYYEPERSSGYLTVKLPEYSCGFEIPGLNLRLWREGRRFVADKRDDIPSASTKGLSRLAAGDFNDIDPIEDALSIRHEGDDSHKMILRPILLDGRRRFLFYRRPCSSNDTDRRPLDPECGRVIAGGHR